MIIEWRIHGIWNRERFGVREGFGFLRELRSDRRVEQATARVGRRFLVVKS